jgi:inorganic triphosphatase YgiF
VSGATSPRPDVGASTEADLAATRTAPEPLEIEVKLGVSRPLRIARLVRTFEGYRLAGFQPLGDARLVTVTDRYVDTAQVGGWLQALGMRARLRSQGRTVVLAVKRSGSERAGVTVRVELQADATASLDPRHWPASAARAALLEAIGQEPLQEIAVLRQRRLIRPIGSGSTTVELSLDRVDAMEHGRVLARRHELEAELLSGDERALGNLADALLRLDGITPPVGSKLAFGIAARKAMASRGPSAEPGTAPES